MDVMEAMSFAITSTGAGGHVSTSPTVSFSLAMTPAWAEVAACVVASGDVENGRTFAPATDSGVGSV